MPEQLRVLLIEDEALVAMDMQDALEEAGYVVVASAGTIQQAIEAAGTTACDIALLDVNVAGAPVFPAAEVLRDRGITIVFTTGYGVKGLPAEWRAYPVLAKPVSRKEVIALIEGMIGAPAPSGNSTL